MKLTTFNVSRLAMLVLVTSGHNVMATISMGAAATYGVVADTTITNSGFTVITGNLAVCPGSAITGFPPGIVTGTKDLGSSTPGCNAEAACNTAYSAAKGSVPTIALQSSDLCGVILSPGFYTFPSAGATASCSFTLNGSSTSQWVFKITTTFTTAANIQDFLIGGAKACNVYFVAGSSITLGANDTLGGNFIANTAVTIGAATRINGTVCALTAAITLSDDAVKAQGTC